MTEFNIESDKKMVCSRLKRFLRLGLLIAIVGIALGNTDCPGDPNRPATITCRDFNIRLDPGTCKVFPNPCSDNGEWAGGPEFDGIRLEPTEEQQGQYDAADVHLVTTRVRGETTRSLCVAANAQHFVNQPIDFVYGLGQGFGVARMFVQTAPPLSVSVTASPSAIARGQTSQLVATASGGIRPYFYTWVPTIGLNDTDIAAPIASPETTTEYRVRVSDSSGQEVIGSTTISVGFSVSATATPALINAGDVSVLLATAFGGDPPYTFSWTPADSLDDAHVQNPTASPTTTTTYNVVARDSSGATASTSVTTSVRLAVTATANPDIVDPGHPSQLLATAVGGSPPYTFSWTPTVSLDDPFRQNPTATPAAETQYSVIVTDSVGQQSAAPVTVRVRIGTPPTAAFVYQIAGPRTDLDASLSTGNIIRYLWDFSWTTVNPDIQTASPFASFFFQEFDRGTITLTVLDQNGNTATAMRNFPFDGSSPNRTPSVGKQQDH